MEHKREESVADGEEEEVIYTPPLTVHQIWLGPELPPEDNKTFVESAIKYCGKGGYKYKLWKMDDLTSTFPHDSVYYMWDRLWSKVPYPAILAAAVDYYKWHILATTPENERAIFMDMDVEMRDESEKEGERYEIPLSQSHISFGISPEAEKPSVSFLYVFGPDAARIALHEANKKLSLVDIDSSTFLDDFYASCSNGQRNSDLSLGTRWIEESLLSSLEEAELSSDIASLELFSNFGQYASPIFLHNRRFYSTGGKGGQEEIAEYRKEVGQQIHQSSVLYNAEKKKVVVAMSSAKSYDWGLKRTLGLLTPKDLRDIQRKTTFGGVKNYPNVDFFFIVGRDGAGLEEEEAASPDFYYAPVGEDIEGKKRMALRFYNFLQWMAFQSNYEFIFFCEDDNYIHLPRLFSFCTLKQAGEMNVYGNEDEEGDLTHGGVLVPAIVARKIMLAHVDPPKEGEDFGRWMRSAVENLGGEFILDDKFSPNKGQYPTPTNGRITTHEVNPYDLVALAGMNAPKED